MEIQKDLEIGIGTKDPTALKPAVLRIENVEIKSAMDRHGKVVGDKVVFICKHPDKVEPIEISSVEYLKDKKIVKSGIWLNKDEDGNIRKGSALAYLLEFLKVKNLKETILLPIATSLDDNGYLILKGY